MGFGPLIFVTFVSSFAAISAAQTGLPKELAQLVRIRQRTNQNQDRLPNYTCLETITRSSRPPRSLVISRNGRPGRFLPQDIVRLEVADVNGQEFFASPGAYNFAETDISTFVTGGMIGNGLFAQFAREVFNPALPTYRFAGETNVAGRPLLRYDYQVSLLLSNYLLKCIGEAKVGYHGSFWADPKTFDLVRLDIQADDIPYAVGVVTAVTRIDYGVVRLGAADVLLPQSAEMTMLVYNDWENRNNIAFTHCKEYGTDSAISFEPPSVSLSVAPPPPKEIEIPAGVVLATHLDTALDSDIAGRGNRVRARIETDVKHNGVVLIPKDTIVTGRIRTIDRYMSPSHYFLIALEFYRFEFPRGPVRFFAEMQKISPPPGGAPPMTIVRTPERPGVATFAIKGDSVLLPPGTRMVWKTSRYGPSHPGSR
jgi:hypothetical protein